MRGAPRATPSAARLDTDVAGAHRTAGAGPELGHHRGPQTLQVARAGGEDEVDDIVAEGGGGRPRKAGMPTARLQVLRRATWALSCAEGASEA